MKSALEVLREVRARGKQGIVSTRMRVFVRVSQRVDMAWTIGPDVYRRVAPTDGAPDRGPVIAFDRNGGSMMIELCSLPASCIYVECDEHRYLHPPEYFDEGAAESSPMFRLWRM